MTAATVDPAQAALDAEDCHEFRAAVRKLCALVRRRQAEEGQLKEVARDMAKARKEADAALSEVIEEDGLDDAAFAAEAARRTRAAEAANEAARATRQKWERAVFARRRAQDELRVRMKRQFERLPLIDEAGKWNGAPEPNGLYAPPPKPKAELDAEIGAFVERALAKAPADGWPWPDWLTDDAVSAAYIGDKFPDSTRRLTKPVGVKAFEWDGRLWVVPGTLSRGRLMLEARLLPLLPAGEFEERYIAYPTKYQPDLRDDANDEDRRQYYTGVTVKHGGKEHCICPAGEGRKLVRTAAKDPIDAPCPKCRVGPGEKCRNYKGRNKQTCPDRGKPEEDAAPAPEAGLFPDVAVDRDYGRDVFEPAEAAAEGWRVVKVEGAYAEYRVAELPSGLWAMECDYGFYGGDGREVAWQAFADRKAAVNAFRAKARGWFEQTPALGPRAGAVILIRLVLADPFIEPEPRDGGRQTARADDPPPAPAPKKRRGKKGGADA